MKSVVLKKGVRVRVNLYNLIFQMVELLYELYYSFQYD